MNHQNIPSRRNHYCPPHVTVRKLLPGRELKSSRTGGFSAATMTCEDVTDSLTVPGCPLVSAAPGKRPCAAVTLQGSGVEAGQRPPSCPMLESRVPVFVWLGLRSNLLLTVLPPVQKGCWVPMSLYRREHTRQKRRSLTSPADALRENTLQKSSKDNPSQMLAGRVASWLLPSGAPASDPLLGESATSQASRKGAEFHGQLLTRLSTVAGVETSLWASPLCRAHCRRGARTPGR